MKFILPANRERVFLCATTSWMFVRDLLDKRFVWETVIHLFWTLSGASAGDCVCVCVSVCSSAPTAAKKKKKPSKHKDHNADSFIECGEYLTQPSLCRLLQKQMCSSLWPSSYPTLTCMGTVAGNVERLWCYGHIFTSSIFRDPSSVCKTTTTTKKSVVLFSYGFSTEWCRTSSGKSGTSVRYQSFGFIASGHLENICTDRRSQKFL